MYEDYEQISKAANDHMLQRYADGNQLRKDLKLHAWNISFTNPETNEPISFQADPPAHMQALLSSTGMSVPL